MIKYKVIAAFVIGFFGAAALALYLPDRKIKTHSPSEEFAAFLDFRVQLIYMESGVIFLVKTG